MTISILIADDSSLIRNLMRAMLESHGFVVCGEADDGAEAVQKTNS